MTNNEPDKVVGENAVTEAAAFSGIPVKTDFAGPDARARSAFLLTASDRLAAGAYEEMLKKNGISVILETNVPGGQFAVVMDVSGAAPAPSVNIYVPVYQRERARELADAFDNEPIVYNTPPPALNRKSRSGRLVFSLIVFIIFVVPIGLSLYVIADRVVRFFQIP